MVGAFEADEAALLQASDAVAGQARQLDRTFDGFGAAVREKHAIQARELDEFLGEPSLVLVAVEVRNVDQFGGLVTNRLHDSRVRVAERVDAQAGDEVEVLLPLEVEEENSFAALKGDRVAVVSLEKIAALEVDDLFKVCHGNQDST